MNNIVLIAAAEAEDAARAAGGDLETRLRAAMGSTMGHWLATREEDQFTAAMEATARTCDEDELARMEAEVRSLKTLEAVLSGVPVDWDALAPDEDAPVPLGAMKMWRQIRDENGGGDG